jgi:hypothetical protein
MDLLPLLAPAAIKRIKPSFYNAALKCKARAGWQQIGTRKLALPQPERCWAHAFMP